VQNLGVRTADRAVRQCIYRKLLLRYISSNAALRLRAAHWGNEVTFQSAPRHIDGRRRSQEYIAITECRPMSRKTGGTIPSLAAVDNGNKQTRSLRLNH
jgi:hypothetical protein